MLQRVPNERLLGFNLGLFASFAFGGVLISGKLEWAGLFFVILAALILVPRSPAKEDI